MKKLLSTGHIRVFLLVVMLTVVVWQKERIIKPLYAQDNEFEIASMAVDERSNRRTQEEPLNDILSEQVTEERGEIFTEPPVTSPGNEDKMIRLATVEEPNEPERIEERRTESQLIGQDQMQQTSEWLSGIIDPSSIEGDKKSAPVPYVKRCHPEPVNQVDIPDEGTFQIVETNKTWVVSAHVDHRHTNDLLIRVFGLTSELSTFTQNGSKTVYCQLWDGNRRLLAVYRTNMTNLYKVHFRIENFQMKCHFDPDLYEYNVTILSVATDPCGAANNALAINDNIKSGRSEVNYTVCICGPLKYNYSDYQRLIEWMETNRILGAGRTIIYNYESSELVGRVLDYYRRRNLLEVYQVNSPYIYDDARWIKQKKADPAYAKFALRHDCLMREMFRTKFVAMLDVDETIVPRRTSDYTWDDMIRSAGCENGSYVLARNVFFHVDLVPGEAASDEMAKTYRLFGLTVTLRRQAFHPAPIRSKYLIKPEHASIISTHKVFLSPHYRSCVLSPDVGALHHYRRSKITGALVLDRTMSKYKKELLNNVQRVYSDLRGVFKQHGISVWDKVLVQ